jgi:hypothetical protein
MKEDKSKTKKRTAKAVLGLTMALFVIFSIILIKGETTYSWCYQESANTSNQTGTDGSCGLNYTGGSYSTIESWTNLNNAYDGNWSNYACASPGGTLYINYSKSANVVSALWKNSDGGGQFNITILSTCLSRSRLELRILDTDCSTTQYDCYNGTWQALSSRSNGVIYEEAMWWNISTTTSPPAPTNSSITTMKGSGSIILKGNGKLTFK